MKRTVLIVNPKATRVTEEGISAVERALMGSTYVRTVRTERPRHAVELAREAGDADALIVFSGDGGFNEEKNGVERNDQPLGFVPGGGTSVLPRARALAGGRTPGRPRLPRSLRAHAARAPWPPRAGARSRRLRPGRIRARRQRQSVQLPEDGGDQGEPGGVIRARAGFPRPRLADAEDAAAPA